MIIPDRGVIQVSPPKLVSGAVAHWDATLITGVANSTQISSWADQSGNGYNFSQGTTASQPTYKQASINGHPSVSFDGAYYMTGTMSLAAANTVFVVAQPIYLENYGHFFGAGTSVAYGNNQGSPYLSNASGTNLVGSTGLTVGKMAVLTYVNNGTTSAVRINGVETDGSAAASSAQTTISIGASSTGSGPTDSYIGEIIVYNSILTAAQIRQNENFLNFKWSLGAVAGVDYPAGTTTAPSVASLQSQSWTLKFNDDFTGTTLDTTRWENCDGWTSGSGLVTSAANLSLANSVLTLSAPSAGSGAKILSDPAAGAGANGYAMMPGDVVEFRAKFPGNASGIFNWPAIWTSASNSNWPAQGEVDVAEAGNGPLQINYHYGSPPNGSSQNDIATYTLGQVAASWHVWTFQRGSGTNGYKVWLDGQFVAQWTSQDGGGGEGACVSTGTASGATGYNAYYGSQSAFQVDYVRIWSPPTAAPAIASTGAMSHGTTATLNAPAGLVTGDLVVAYVEVHWFETTTAPTIADVPMPSGWTNPTGGAFLATDTVDNAYLYQTWWYTYASSSTPAWAGATITPPSLNSTAVGQIYATTFKITGGTRSGNPFVDTFQTGSVNSSASITFPTFTPGGNYSLLLAGIISDSSGGRALPSGWTSVGTANGSDGSGADVLRQSQTTATAVSGTFSASGGTSYSVLIGTIRP